MLKMQVVVLKKRQSISGLDIKRAWSLAASFVPDFILVHTHVEKVACTLRHFQRLHVQFVLLCGWPLLVSGFPAHSTYLPVAASDRQNWSRTAKASADRRASECERKIPARTCRMTQLCIGLVLLSRLLYPQGLYASYTYEGRYLNVLACRI
jgi:hypothetical protein